MGKLRKNYESLLFTLICCDLRKLGESGFKLEERWRSFQVCCWHHRTVENVQVIRGASCQKTANWEILSAYGNGNHTQMNMKSIWDGLFWIFMNISEIISHHFAEKIWWKDTSREMRMMEHDSFFRCGPCVGWIFWSEASRNGNWPWGVAPGWRIICGVKLCVIMCSSIMVMICQYISVYFRISEWWWFIILSKA